MAITLDTFKTFFQGAGNNIQAPEGGGVSQRLVLTVNGELRLRRQGFYYRDFVYDKNPPKPVPKPPKTTIHPKK